MSDKTKNMKDFNEVRLLKRKLEGNGIGFIVERIENERDLKELLDYDINYGQGYLFARPMDPSDVEQFITSKTEWIKAVV